MAEPTIEMTEEGGAIVDLDPQPPEGVIQETPFDANLAGLLDDSELGEISTRVIAGYDADKQSRADWEDTITKGIELLGIDFRKGDTPFDGACTATHPLVVENVVKFQSKAIAEMIPASGPVRTQIIGLADEAIEKQASRIKDFMNYQVMEQMTEYYDDTERMLFSLGLCGSAFKKCWYDATRERPVIEFVQLSDFVCSYWAQDLDRAIRYTHVLHKTDIEFNADVISGRYESLDLPTGNQSQPDALQAKQDETMGVTPIPSRDDSVYDFYEQHCYLSLDVDGGMELPYIVTVERTTQKVVGLYRNWDPTDALKRKLNYFVHYKFVPGFGFYGLGYIHLLGNLNDSATAALRSLVDAGQFANLPGGFKAKGIKVVGGNDPIAPGEWKEIEGSNMDISKSLIPLPYKEPSQTLFALLQFMGEAGQKFADAAETVVADSTNGGPVGTTMALLEQSTKFFSAIHKRLHKSQRDEFRILARIDQWALPAEYPYAVDGADRKIKQADFDGRVDVLPVSDPNITSQAHRLALAQFQFQIAAQAPSLHNMREVLLRVYRAANVQEVDKLVPPPAQAEQADPLTDLLRVTKGMPIAAFPGQDHDAHIAVKSAWLQDPANGQSPFMQQMAPLVAANVREHMIMKYQEQLGGLAQQAAQGQPLPPEVQGQVMAQAAQQVLKANQAAAEAGNVNDLERFLAQVEKMKAENSRMDLALTQERDENTAVLRNRELDIRETDLMLKAVEGGSEHIIAAQQKELDRDANLAAEIIRGNVQLQKERMKPKPAAKKS